MHVTVSGLVANRWYYYRFTALGHRSRTGRTRTMPAANVLPKGVRFAVVSCQNWVGGRYLNKRNTALADAYFTWSASLGYRQGRWEARASGRNLGNRRDPVAESELGDAQYYRLPHRRFDVSASVRF